MAPSRKQRLTGAAAAAAAKSQEKEKDEPTLAMTLSISSLPRPFKNPNFRPIQVGGLTGGGASGPRRNRTIKQILMVERERGRWKEGWTGEGYTGVGVGIGGGAVGWAGVGMKRTTSDGGAAGGSSGGGKSKKKKTGGGGSKSKSKKATKGAEEVVGDMEEDGSTRMDLDPNSPNVTEALDNLRKINLELIPEEGEDEILEEDKQYRNKGEWVGFTSVEAPPSLIPAKKYCDVTGLDAAYMDPRTQLRYHNTEVYELIKNFSPDTVQAHLSLRGRGVILR